MTVGADRVMVGEDGATGGADRATAGEDRATAGTAKAWRVTGTLAIALVMVAGAGQTWSIVAQQQKSSTRQFDGPIHRLRLETGSASVRVRAGREDHVVVHQRLDWMGREPEVSLTPVGDQLTVGLHCRLILPALDLGCGAEIEVEVPAATQVSGAVSSGSVQVEGMSGNVDVRLTSGQLMLVDTSGDVTAHTTSGMIQGTNLSSRRVTAETTSGSMELNFTKPPQQVETRATSGSVNMTLPRGSRYAFTGETGSGSGGIDPQLTDSASPNRIHATVTSGSVSINPS
ncbi:DUF4097 family beta strand repeat-containing protein [Streptomyces sp. 1331.2]|uniref:DUF4097 family beta strand repeat-containing protein n=1 Tax=Streptomyces sp. 1331.2 TaxID=1938835 RepID=UPI000BCF628F|nr:DUF4097 family beta strand repeat-containing protein [Streptomyces sp. 1331.2]SOB84298.1 Putative adhesin [Streptomyces sp. 1331.2]